MPQQLNLAIDRELSDWLDQTASERGINRAEFTRELLRASMEGRLVRPEEAPVIDPRTAPELLNKLREMVTSYERTNKQIEKRDRLIEQAIKMLRTDDAAKRVMFTIETEDRVRKLIAPTVAQVDAAADRIEKGLGLLRREGEQAIASVGDAFQKRLIADPTLGGIDGKLDRIANAHESVRSKIEIHIGEHRLGLVWALVRLALIVALSLMAMVYLGNWFPRTIGVPTVEFMIGHDDRIVRALIEHRDLHVVPAPGNALVGTPIAPASKPQPAPARASKRHAR